MAAEYTHGNANSLQQLLADPNVDVRPFPDDVVQHLKALTGEVVAELMATDPASARVGEAYYEYLEIMEANTRISEHAYLNTRK